MVTGQELFGGRWTDSKLERVRKYLVAYATIMAKQKYKFAYIDAFAGTGYMRLPEIKHPKGLTPLFDLEPKVGKSQYKEGSARIALNVRPRFDKYIFVEKKNKHFRELMKLKDEHPDLRDDILLVNSDANSYLIELCSNSSWSKHRAVLFLDPFGMQVSWEAIKAIAATKAIDMWYLFPLGVGVNRMLKKDGNIDSVWRQKLNDMFGTTEWYQAFYNSFTRQGLFGSVDLTKKYGDFRVVSKFFIDRLKTIFAGVAENPLPLYNSKNNPMYLLCFASGNPRGAETAIKIAQSILKRHY